VHSDGGMSASAKTNATRDTPAARGDQISFSCIRLRDSSGAPPAGQHQREETHMERTPSIPPHLPLSGLIQMMKQHSTTPPPDRQGGERHAQ
jgi:hypothetical protein